MGTSRNKILKRIIGGASMVGMGMAMQNKVRGGQHPLDRRMPPSGAAKRDQKRKELGRGPLDEGDIGHWDTEPEEPRQPMPDSGIGSDKGRKGPLTQPGEGNIFSRIGEDGWAPTPTAPTDNRFYKPGKGKGPSYEDLLRTRTPEGRGGIIKALYGLYRGREQFERRQGQAMDEIQEARDNIRGQLSKFGVSDDLIDARTDELMKDKFGEDYESLIMGTRSPSDPDSIM